MAPAERAKAYRARRKATGCKEVKCYLEPEHIAYLSAVCTAHQVHIAEAVALALTALIRGEAPRATRTEIERQSLSTIAPSAVITDLSSGAPASTAVRGAHLPRSPK